MLQRGAHRHPDVEGGDVDSQGDIDVGVDVLPPNVGLDQVPSRGLGVHAGLAVSWYLRVRMWPYISVERHSICHGGTEGVVGAVRRGLFA